MVLGYKKRERVQRLLSHGGSRFDTLSSSPLSAEFVSITRVANSIAQFSQSLSFNLSYAFPCQAKFFADFFKRMRVEIVEAKSHAEDSGLS